MNSQLRQYAQRFDAQTIRERALIAFSVLVAIGFLWWSYYADPVLSEIDLRQTENQRIEAEIQTSRVVVGSIRQRIAAGVHKEQEQQLQRLAEELKQVEDQLRVKTIELIDPEKMFQLMNQLIYSDSGLKLLSLKRREVKPAIPVLDADAATEEAGIYRHVLEIEFAGSYLDILQYMQSLEKLDWKLLWDEIDIIASEHPKVTVKVVMSTLSTRKEWVGI